MLEAGGSLGSPQTPELQGISVIPAGNHEVGQGGRWALTSDSLGAGLEEALSPWCPCYLHEHILLPVPTWEGCSVSQAGAAFPLQELLCLGQLVCSAGRTLAASRPGASGAVLGDPCWSRFWLVAGRGCVLALPVGQTRSAARTRVRGPSSNGEEEALRAL